MATHPKKAVTKSAAKPSAGGTKPAAGAGDRMAAALNARAGNMKLRGALAAKYNTSMYSLGLGKIRETMERLKIPEKDVHPNLLKPPYPSPHTRARADAEADRWGSIPLEAIPGKSQPGVGKGNYKRVIAPSVSPNHAIILRVLDMLEKPDLPQPTADRLLAVVEKLADKIG
jgi:hypothetical protein